jgi:formylmethanofuran dehydrogenase subunit E
VKAPFEWEGAMVTIDQLAAEIQRACDVTAIQHGRLCPRQVLGVRVGLAAGRVLHLELPRNDKRLMIFAETDGCFVDGVGAATGSTVGHRTLRVVDYGRVAVTAVDVETGSAIRIAPRVGIRKAALAFAPAEHRRYFAQIEGYSRMSDCDLLTISPVTLTVDMAAIIGRRGVRVDCSACGEEVLNGREQSVAGAPVCPGCMGDAYYAQSD